MRVVVITPPDPVVLWGEADAHLQLGGDVSQQAYVESLITAATAQIDGPSGWLSRAIGVQTLELRFSLLTCGHTIRLPYPPVVDVISVKYIGMDDIEHVADLADFELFGDSIAPEGSDWTWTGGSLKREAGRIRYRAGYEIVPAPIKTAILMMVASMFENREASGSTDSNMADGLLAPYRVFL